MAWRNLLKNKVSSFINICGLSVGFATGIIILLVVLDEGSYDKFHVHLKDTYLLMRTQYLSEETKTGTATPGPLAASLRAEIPEVKYAARVAFAGDQLVRNGDKSTYEDCMYAEPDFFNIMSFPALEGNPLAVLREPDAIVITERTAKKLFNGENAIGKMLVFNNLLTLKVAAVIRDVPLNSTSRFDVVLPFLLFEPGSPRLSKWDDNHLQTWIQTQPNTRLDVLNTKLKNLFLQKQDEKNNILFAYPFADLHLHGQFSNGKPSGGIIDIMMLLGCIGVFVLLIACINFMNLSTARSQQRAREVGIRKAMGANRKRIILQFLSEALLLSFLALLLGVVLAQLALPGFMRMAGRDFKPDLLNWRICGLVLGLWLVTGLLAGSYPAFYLSRFEPVKVLKNLLPAGEGGRLLRKGLVTFQFVISIFLVITTIVIFRQLHYVERRPLGYNPENLIEIPARGGMKDKFDLLKNELLQLPGVKSVSAGGDNLVRFGGGMNGVEWPGKTADQDLVFTIANVQYDWVKTVGLKMVEGRDFSRAYGADSFTCLINEAAVKSMHLKMPVAGMKLNNNAVIGVVQDFVYNDPTGTPRPMIIYLNTGSLDHFFVRIENNENWQECLSKIERVVKKINPGYPFEFNFTKEEYQKRFNVIRSIGYMANTFGGMAIFISCMGLFGLSAFLAERRSKEVSIRKVLGADIGKLWFLLCKDFLKPVLVAFILTAPLAGWVMQKLLHTMDYHIELSWWMFVLAGVSTILVAIITVSFHGIKTALANPVKFLQAE
ncbi:ABC-type transport system, involved in lipoprotein release, permease component [Chitinophaga sp. CF118]|nr:ABC-type transport system, involved in lipoprotein release, permease component [Chitinophaga sp. CF118]